VRQSSLALLSDLGFRVASGLPTARGDRTGVRPGAEIVARLMALKVLFLRVSVTEEQASEKLLRSCVEQNDLERWMAEDERAIWSSSREEATEAHLDTIGWKLENLWPLAWVLGFSSPPTPRGHAIDDDTTAELVTRFSPRLRATVADFLAAHPCRPEAEIVALEDLFYCAHNAARSAQLGSNTVPRGFDPVSGGGVIHERRHALTWCLSSGVSWDDTDLST
jgi:hypothetical protein